MQARRVGDLDSDFQGGRAKSEAADRAKVAADCRWAVADVRRLQEYATQLDERRQSYMEVVLLLLLWRQRVGGGGGGASVVGGGGEGGAAGAPTAALATTSAAAAPPTPAALAFAELPEESMHTILLHACPDAGLAGLWRISFDEIARHARIMNTYARKGQQLRWWLRHQRGRDEEADEAKLEKLSHEEYEEAQKEAKALRRAGGGGPAATCERSRRRAIEAVEAFAEDVGRVLYGKEIQ